MDVYEKYDVMFYVGIKVIGRGSNRKYEIFLILFMKKYI